MAFLDTVARSWYGVVMTTTYYKTTVTIYSPFNPMEVELVDLAQDATDGSSFCPFYISEPIDPSEPEFPREFFNLDDEDLSEFSSGDPDDGYDYASRTGD